MRGCEPLRVRWPMRWMPREHSTHSVVFQVKPELPAGGAHSVVEGDMPLAGRVTEDEIGTAILRALSDQPNNEASLDELSEKLPHYVDLSEEDREASRTRESEELWEQHLRNIVNHRETSGNIINDGLVEWSPNRMMLTPAGRAYLDARH